MTMPRARNSRSFVVRGETPKRYWTPQQGEVIYIEGTKTRLGKPYRDPDTGKTMFPLRPAVRGTTDMSEGNIRQVARVEEGKGLESVGSMATFSYRNPGVRAQVRRLPSGQVQIKVPLRRGENPNAKARQVAKALGRRIVSVKAGNPSSGYVSPDFGVYEWSEVTRSSYPWLMKYTVATYQKGQKVEPDMRLVRVFRTHSMAQKYADKLEREWEASKRNPCGRRVANLAARKVTGGYYKVGEFHIHKAFIPMPGGQDWTIYRREGQVADRAASLKAAVKRAKQLMGW